MDVYIQQTGTKIKKEKNHFLIRTKEKNNLVAPSQIDTIVIEENISITTNAIKLAIDNDIAIYLSDNYGNIFGKFWKSGFERTSRIRSKQLIVFRSKYGNCIGKKWIIEKIETQKNHIKK